MEQFDTLPIQCKHIEHVHEGVWFRKEIDKITAMKTPWELNIYCTSTTIESRAKIWYQ